MSKNFIPTLLVLFLIAPLAELEARGYHKDPQHSPSKYFRFSNKTIVDLESLKQALSDINAKIVTLELQAGDLPEELASALAKLELAIEANSSDITMALDDIIKILIDIEEISGHVSDNGIRLTSLESAVSGLVDRLALLETKVESLDARILALEQPSPPITFSGVFGQGAAPVSGTQDAWKDFLSNAKNAKGSFRSITITSSLSGSGSVICSNKDAASAIAKALNNHVWGGATVTFTCDGLFWNVGQFGSIGSGAALSAGGTKAVNDCDADASVRPLVTHSNWGGVGTTCGALSQTLEVVLTP